MSQVELATVQESVSNPTIGKMRMQFWRDAIKGISDVRLEVLQLFRDLFGVTANVS